MSRPFIAIFPQTIKDGDKIIVKGVLKENPKEYSINFATGDSLTPEDIAYHFKVVPDENLFVENSKLNGEWLEEKVTERSLFDGPEFALEFAFTDGSVYVYDAEDEVARNFITVYEQYLVLKTHSVQVWGDVEELYELRYESGSRIKKGKG